MEIDLRIDGDEIADPAAHEQSPSEIPEASQQMESNCARQAVAGFSFVKFAGDELAERKVVEPSQCVNSLRSMQQPGASSDRLDRSGKRYR
ncbi:hypothetical protein [Mesorhizobium sp. Cs1299R1N1]|uniref:hypothetical protein n=1 Tax=Mesorhizobium sp. Cs1299R1N1 TaxID=3015172 RepID=UPI003FA57D5D